MIACHSIHDHICCHGISYDLVFMSHSQSQPWYPAYEQVRLVDIVGCLAALDEHLYFSSRMSGNPRHLPTHHRHQQQHLNLPTSSYETDDTFMQAVRHLSGLANSHFAFTPAMSTTDKHNV